METVLPAEQLLKEVIETEPENAVNSLLITVHASALREEKSSVIEAVS